MVDVSGFVSRRVVVRSSKDVGVVRSSKDVGVEFTGKRVATIPGERVSIRTWTDLVGFGDRKVGVFDDGRPGC